MGFGADLGAGAGCWPSCPRTLLFLLCDDTQSHPGCSLLLYAQSREEEEL